MQRTAIVMLCRLSAFFDTGLLWQNRIWSRAFHFEVALCLRKEFREGVKTE